MDSTWRCPSCDTYNRMHRDRCMICDRPRAPATESSVSAGSAPIAGWDCLRCETRNAAASATCAGCGTGWTEATDVLASPPPDPPEETAHQTSTEFWGPISGTKRHTPRLTRLAPAPRRAGAVLTAVLAVAAAFGAVGLLRAHLDAPAPSLGPSAERESPSPSLVGACPERIAGQLPQGGEAALVQAFLTQTKQITLCRTTSGELYYHGEFIDRSDPAIILLANETADGYTASNGPYIYEIIGTEVIVYNEDEEIAREHLVPLWDPE